MIHLRKFIALLSLVGLTTLPFLSQAATSKLSQRPDVQAFIQKLVKEDDFDAKYLNHLFDQVELQPKAIDSISNPAEAKNWQFYEGFFITDKRVSQGYLFWQRHQKVLADLQKQYGVPSSIIVAILGVETFYGEQQGSYRVMDALTTLSFEYPPRQDFFRKELAEYLRLVREHHLAPLELRGSYAGAIGQPQFMPSSYRHYAVPYEGQHYVNLQKDHDDVMASIANYLKENGWQRGEPILAPVQISRKDALKKMTPNIAPSKTIKQLRQVGLKVDGDYDPALEANLIMLAMPKSESPLYYMGFNNFYTITRYNTSVNYAMAIYTLSNILEQCWQEKAKSCSV